MPEQKPVVITADSSADLPADIREEFAIHFLPIYVQLDGTFYQDCVDIFPRDIYEAFDRRGILPKTAAPSIGEYQSFFRQFTERGSAVVHLSLNHQMSSCFRVACLAAEELEDVHVVDTRSFCTASGMLCVQAARLRDAGLGAADIAARLTELRGKIRGYFIPDNLDFISKSGRCSVLAAWGANLLKLRPMVAVDGSTGDLIIGKKYRGQRVAVYEQFLRDACAMARDTMDSALAFFMHTPDMAKEEYERYNALAKELLPHVGRLVTDDVGCTIVSHVGKNCVALITIDASAQPSGA
ncbi:MAG: DegV family protein [Oscillospiraceae bacterium]|nr:DegV family protein [Oscillospiraceae bacterium]